MPKKKTTIKKKVQKDVSSNELFEQIKLIGERIEVVNVDLSGKIQDVSEQVEVTAIPVANVQNRLAKINAKMIRITLSDCRKINGLNNRFDDLAVNCVKTDDVQKRFLRIEKEIGLVEK